MSWPFELLDPAEDFDEASYVALLARLRGFLDALAGASPDPALTSRLTADLGRWQALLAERAADAIGATGCDREALDRIARFFATPTAWRQLLDG